jgi:uncharacterized protein YidB (DUF937 family)
MGLLDQLAGGLGGQILQQLGGGGGQQNPLLQMALGLLQQPGGLQGLMSALAAQIGTSPEQASQSVASLLPDVVDKLTPGGAVGDLQSLVPKDLESLLGGKLFG